MFTKIQSNHPLFTIFAALLENSENSRTESIPHRKKKTIFIDKECQSLVPKKPLN